MLFLILLLLLNSFVNSNIVILNPIFTTSAYQPNSFYDYYENKCNERCLIIPITSNEEYSKTRYSDNFNLRLLSSILLYNQITDIDLMNNPSLIEGKRLIVLHSEYVTLKEFQIITNHENTLFLFPNSLYAQVNYSNNTIQLVRGHGYMKFGNGFDWKNDNTKYETTFCNDIKFENKMLNCWPNDFISYIRILLMLNQ